jgi:beta-glucosidase
VVGETQDTAVESADRTTTKLNDAQLELIRGVCAVNRNTVVVVNAAHAVDMPWAAEAAAVLQVWFPGQEFGPALADVLTGRLEPGGRLPVTFAADEGDYPVFGLQPVDHDLVYEATPSIGYRHFIERKIAPRFAFGHGLGYADFAYEDLSVTADGDEVVLDVTIRNVASRPGNEVVQVYVLATAPEARAAAGLQGIAVVHAGAGERITARISLGVKAFRTWTDAGWRVLPGEYELLVGRSSVDIRLRDLVRR